jgi:multidrug efflux pump subunit AcrA (membrane-fusion protein)
LAITGIVRAEEQVQIKSEFPGIVRRIAVKEGDRVTEGQLLIELDNDRQKIMIDLAQAGLAKAKASVDETSVLLANVEREASRIQIAANALPRKELEDIQDQVLRLKANLAAQRSELTRSEQEVKLREQELKDTRIFAPFNGTVTEIFINRGESLERIETPVLELVDLDELYAELRLPSSFVKNVQLQDSIRVHVEAEWTGRAGQLKGRYALLIPPLTRRAAPSGKGQHPALCGLVGGMLVETRFGNGIGVGLLVPQIEVRIWGVEVYLKMPDFRYSACMNRRNFLSSMVAAPFDADAQSHRRLPRRLGRA